MCYTRFTFHSTEVLLYSAFVANCNCVYMLMLIDELPITDSDVCII